LVVFGDDVLIFSDKEVAWTDAQDSAIAWARWFRKAVKKSAEQIRGAERWIKSFPNRIYLDELCVNQLPLKLPPPEKRRVHGIVIAVGARAACQQYFDGGSGTFLVTPQIKGAAHYKPESEHFRPFAIGDIDPDGAFIHVFDGDALDFVMTELNTTSDFVRYLNKREEFIRSGRLFAAPGEEDLLGYYLQTVDGNQEHDFVSPDGEHLNDGRTAVIQQGQYGHLISRPEYLRKKEADKISFAWDQLIETFVHHILSGTSVPVFGERPDVASAEQGLRLMAAEDRVSRRVLSHSLIDALYEAEKRGADRFARVVIPANDSAHKDVAYIFLVLAYPKSLPGGYEQYRKVRVNFLHAYCLGVLEKNRQFKSAVGIGVDASFKVTGRAGGSEDLLTLEITNWTNELVDQSFELQTKFGILDPKKQKRGGISTTEFPEEEPLSVEPLTRQQKRALERALKKKRTKRRR
jgi:hypothetical protein